MQADKFEKLFAAVLWENKKSTEPMARAFF